MTGSLSWYKKYGTLVLVICKKQGDKHAVTKYCTWYPLSDTKAFGQGVLSERLYKDNFYETNTKRSAIMSEMASIEAEMINKHVIPVEQLIDGVLKLVGNLDFTAKRNVIRKLVTKIIATKQEVTIWGLIPVPVTSHVGNHNNHESSNFANHLENEGKVGLDAINWHRRLT